MEKRKVDAMVLEGAGLKGEAGSFCWVFDFSWQCRRPALPSPRGGRGAVLQQQGKQFAFVPGPFFSLAAGGFTN